MTIKRGGHTFQGFDKPIRTPNHSSGKSHAVVVKVGDKPKLIRFGQQGAKTKPPRKGESDWIKLNVPRSKHAMQRISRRAKHLPHIGQTK
tara:strand:+ start:2797 stop:3066 length:270 start_codon:yes stop_codon:yes gene_type:complete